ncbi:MAG: Na/Pi cotransporter family protein [Erysipelotrichaceae bacterium]|nr:Na/Pi cotransporter family protein [Erysipelotrichaceae bacterium]
MSTTMVFSLLGGLGLFLYGMRMMSDSLTNVAGAKMRSILEKMTKNTLIGVIVGAAFTAVIQSSSAATVLVVSFVNAGLMNLNEAIGIIMGANIGTTITGQLMAFKLSDIAPLFVLTGVIMIMFCRNANLQKIGEIILGFGILFVGLGTMSSSMESMKESEFVVNILTSLKNPMLALLIGLVFTAVIQSSSATVGVIMVLASQGLLSLEICFYITLGCNIGCCISALLACIGGKKNAKRAALIHLLINIIGTVVMAILFALFMPQIKYGIMAITGSQNLTGEALNATMSRNVANANTIFKCFQILICFPITKWIIKATYIIIPGEDEEKEFNVQYIDNRRKYSPATAIPQCTHEVERMAGIAKDNLNLAVESLLNLDVSKLEEIDTNENHIDFLNHEIFEYLNRINQSMLPTEDAEMIGPMYQVVTDIERIGDIAKTIGNITETCYKKQYKLDEGHKSDIRELLVLVDEEFSLSIDMFTHKSLEHLNRILKLEDDVDQKEKKLQKNLSKGY